MESSKRHLRLTKAIFRRWKSWRKFTLAIPTSLPPLPYFQQLAKQSPRDADRQSDLGVLYMKLDGHDREAREQFERALQINPAHRQAIAALRQLNGQ